MASTPILCYECGEYLGSVVEFIKAAKTAYYASILPQPDATGASTTASGASGASNAHSAMDMINLKGELAPIGFILDAVGLKRTCCRKCIIGSCV